MTSAEQTSDRPPLVSVVITTYNRAHLVGRAIESVLQQTYRDLEIVIVDDGSTDGTGDVLERYRAQDDRIRVVALPDNQGVNGAKNAGLDSVSGPFTTMLDSDDEFLPHAIETFVDMFQRLGPAYGMVFCNCVDPDTGEWTGQGLTEDTDVTYEDTICQKLGGEFSGMWRTALVADLRFKSGQGAHESLVWDQLYLRGKVHYQHVAVRKYYRGTPGSVLAFRFDQESNLKAIQARQSYLDVYEQDVASMCPHRLAGMLRMMTLEATLAGERRLATRSALRAMRHRVAPSTLSVLPVPFIPRSVLVPLLRRYLTLKGSKVA